MMLTAHDLKHLHSKVAKPKLSPKSPDWGKNSKLAREAGLDRCALSDWRRRHPDSPLTDEQAIAVMQENKRRWKK